MEASMRALFKQLDESQDGAIQLEELLRLPEILPELVHFYAGSRDAGWSCLSLHRYVGGIVAINLGVALLEHVRAAVGCYSWSLPREPMPLESVREATREEVLEYDTPWLRSRYETVKIALMTLSGWAAMRFVFAFASFATAVLLLNVAALRDRGPWRMFWWRIAQFFIFCFLGGLGFYKVHIKGEMAPQESCKLLLGNHVGTFELIALYGLTFASFVSKSSNSNLPLFHGIVMASEAMMVDRDNANSKEQTIAMIKDRVSDPSSRHLMIFPEGTCNNQKTIFRFQRGAFSSGDNLVQLVLFKFPYRHFNPCFTGAAVGGHEFWDLMWRSCCQFVQHLEVQFLPPYRPTAAEVADPIAFATHMQRTMAAHLHCAVNNFTWKLYSEVHAEYLASRQETRRKRLRQLLLDGQCCPTRSLWRSSVERADKEK